MKRGILVHYINVDHVPNEHLQDFMNHIIADIIGDKNDETNLFNLWENLFHFVRKQETRTQVIRTDNQLDIDNLDIELIAKIKQVIIDHESSCNNRSKELLHETEKG